MRKKLLTFLLVTCLMCGCIASAFAMPSDHDISYYYVYTSNHGALNLRESDNANAAIIAQIPYATQVTLYDYAPGATWVECIYGQYTGYVMTRYLSASKPSGTAASTTTVGSEASEYKRMEASCYYAAVRPTTPTSYVHMRWAPSKSEPVVTNYYNGQVLKVLYQDRNWCQVYDETTGLCGYMMRSFLTYVEPASATVYAVGTIK